MSTTKYANAVAAVKAMENQLLSRSDMEQLINSSGKGEIASLIAAKRGAGSGPGSLSEVWDTISGYAPDDKELKILLYRNDFHNLKAALKAMIAGREPKEYYIRPTNLDLDGLSPALSAKNYEALPEHIRSAAAEAYELLTRTLDGQLADSLIDTAAMRAMQTDAERFGGEFIQSYAKLITATADIKTAYRCAVMKKPRNFVEMAICGSRGLEKEDLADAAVSGTDTLFALLESTDYDEGGRLLAKSPALFEKWCDDVIMELAENARMKVFGADPLAAYYIAAEAELKNLRIITVCKESGAARDTITERMRKLYV